MNKCILCDRDVPINYQEKHHLIPKSKKGKGTDTAEVCVDCGDQLHKLFTNKELKDEYNTIDKLKTNEKIQKWIDWVKKRKLFGSVCMKTKKKKR